MKKNVLFYKRDWMSVTTQPIILKVFRNLSWTIGDKRAEFQLNWPANVRVMHCQTPESKDGSPCMLMKDAKLNISS